MRFAPNPSTGTGSAGDLDYEGTVQQERDAGKGIDPHDAQGSGSLSIQDLKASRATQGETVDDSAADGSQDGDSQEAPPQSNKGGMASALTAIETALNGILEQETPPPELEPIFLGLITLGRGTGAKLPATWVGFKKWVKRLKGPKGLLRWMKRLDRAKATELDLRLTR